MKIKTFFTVISIISAIFWLSRCTNSQPKDTALSAEEQKVFIEKGQAIAAATFAELSGKLTAAIEEKGIAGAMEYCNLVALPLVDSLSQVHNATIRRTSLKVRNLKDEPQNWEQEILTDFEKKAQQGEALKPVIRQPDDRTVAFAAPIKVLPLCLKCHGTVGTDISDGDYQTIQALYPQDQAINYKEGDLRGMWSITFQR